MSVSQGTQIRELSPVPLGWAGATTAMNYLNFGDALSPVMVALVGGRPVRRVPFVSDNFRLAAVGTIGHGFRGGEVHFWGTGASSWSNPSAPLAERVPYQVPADTRMVIRATRGPVSQDLLGGGRGGPDVFGDPVWLLPRFYRPKVEKKWKLGVILHLSELADRGFAATPAPHLARFVIPDAFRDDVHLITTVTPIAVEALKDKIDEILACERIVSTSLHGMVIAESYGIPCLHFSARSPRRGLERAELARDGGIDLRIVDLYQGLGQTHLNCYAQPRNANTDWGDVMKTIDDVWSPLPFDGDRLIDAFPLGPSPLVDAPSDTIWSHPVIRGLEFQHDVAKLREDDRKAHAAGAAAMPQPAHRPPALGRASRARLETLLGMNARTLRVPLAWVASTQEHPDTNLGDGLSAVIVSGLSGIPVSRASFDEPSERLVAVGTIGQNMRSGRPHFWGTGIDATRNPVDPLIHGYIRPPHTDFTVHALRGPFSARTLRATGIDAPGIYGDPVCLLKRFWPMEGVEKTHDLGVIAHISELESPAAGAAVKSRLARYQIPSLFRDRIRIINTYCAPTLQAMQDKVREILSCEAILSTSLHGLVIAETYGIPCAWFGAFGTGIGGQLELDNPRHRVDHRVADFYAGAGRSTVSAYCNERNQKTEWQAALRFVHAAWRPLNFDGRPLFDAFPLPLAVSWDDPVWTVPDDVVAQIRF